MRLHYNIKLPRKPKKLIYMRIFNWEGELPVKPCMEDDHPHSQASAKTSQRFPYHKSHARAMFSYKCTRGEPTHSLSSPITLLILRQTLLHASSLPSMPKATPDQWYSHRFPCHSTWSTQGWAMFYLLATWIGNCLWTQVADYFYCTLWPLEKVFLSFHNFPSTMTHHQMWLIQYRTKKLKDGKVR
jgi:hypothetical protein